MVGVDVGDDGDHRLQMQERRIRFVGFDDDEFAAAELRVRRRPLSAGRRSRTSDPCPPSASTLAIRLVVVVLPCVPAIAMPCLNRISSASIIARGTTGIRSRARRDDFGVVVLDRRRHDHDVGARDMFGVVAAVDLRAQLRETLRDRARRRSEPLTW